MWTFLLTFPPFWSAFTPFTFRPGVVALPSLPVPLTIFISFISMLIRNLLILIVGTTWMTSLLDQPYILFSCTLAAFRPSCT
ncbi:hypothetical protein EDD85DRAFT_841052 [Armillaria nabsnona]|nr:hypothetical protein EDD85DRAFT_841052 [Armillaria nabsnona]